MLVRTISRPAVDHNARASSGNVADLVVGGLCQRPAAAVALDTAADRLSAKLSDLVAAENMLHTDRVDLKSVALDRYRDIDAIADSPNDPMILLWYFSCLNVSA